MAEVKFSVDAREHDGTYGIVLWIDDPTTPDVTPTFRSVLRGAPGFDLVKLVELWGECHREAMDEVGIGGSMDRDDYESRLLASVVRAGDLMERHSYSPVGFSTLSEDVRYLLFVESESVDN